MVNRIHMPPEITADQVEIPPDQVELDAMYVTLKVNGHGYSEDGYFFKLIEVDTPMKALKWVSHLSHKVWFNGRMAGELVNKLADRFGWNIHDTNLDG